MRLAVRHQLSILLIVSTSIGLTTLAVATWLSNHDFVLRVARDGMETAASIKAVGVAITLDLMYSSCLYLAADSDLQQALMLYNNGSDVSRQNWETVTADLTAALSSVGSLRHAPGVQAQLRSTWENGPLHTSSVVNVTGTGNTDLILPGYFNEDGTPIHLGEDDVYGFPPQLYPNLTITKGDNTTSSASYLATYNGLTLDLHSNLVLGPITINETVSLMSMTMPVVENNSETNVLGWLTIVQDARIIHNIIYDDTGMGKTARTLLLGPVNNTNHFPPDVLGSRVSDQTDVRYLLPVRADRTRQHTISTAGLPFPAHRYPAVAAAVADGFHGRREIGSLLGTHDEDGNRVSVAYSTPPSTIVNWIVMVERTTDDVYEPVTQLRTIILACLFSVLGFCFFASLPLAHWATRPITRLKAATESTIDPLYGASDASFRSAAEVIDPPMGPVRRPSVKISFLSSLVHRHSEKSSPGNSTSHNEHHKRFRIPSKVDAPKHWVKDDISDLIGTFNEMADELYSQHAKLEGRVQQRTIELNQSKKAAEAANKSKTLFVANVSHELKTPLNGILGMCAVSIEEDDVQAMKNSLSIIYKSGDLLLRTLNDLLTFSTNQVGSRELTLEEKEFTFHDLESQVYAIFEAQSKDRSITLRVESESSSGPLNGFGRPGNLKDVVLWGDIHRILQIVINLISNSMKYTPAGGSVVFSVRRSREPAPRRLLLGPDQESIQSQRSRVSAIWKAAGQGGTANFINPAEEPELRQMSVAPPGNDLYVDFEVRDTGQGIPEEMQSRIFEPFVQGEVGLNRRHSGTGLGLSICSQLASLMKGSISLQSTLGLGSTFTVRIPLRQVLSTPTTKTSQDAGGTTSIALSPATSLKDVKTTSEPHTDSTLASSEEKTAVRDMALPVPTLIPADEPPSDATPQLPTNIVSYEHRAITPVPNGRDITLEVKEPTIPPTTAAKPRKKIKEDDASEQHDFSGLRVLIAEDNKVNQQVIVRMLKMEQITQVTVAEDGQEALELVRTSSSSDIDDPFPFDLIFMDIQMPNMDGLESTRHIRALTFTRPIVALTAFAEKTNVDDCYSAGMNYFIPKPLKRPALHEVLTKLCPNRRHD